MYNDPRDHQAHQGALAIMHKIPISHPLLALAPHLPLLTSSPFRRDQVFRKMIAQVLCDCSRLGDCNRSVPARNPDLDYRRFAERIDLFQLIGRGLLLCALVGFDLKIDVAALFEQPCEGLSAGFLEPRLTDISAVRCD